MPGFRDARIYPLDGPICARRERSRVATRGAGRPCSGRWTSPALAAAQVVEQNLEQIGLEVEIKALPLGAYFREAAAPEAPFDIAFVGWAADYLDPSSTSTSLFDGRLVGTTTSRTSTCRSTTP